MLYKTHISTAACASIPILYTTNTLSLITLVGVSLGALAPDLDEPKSYIGRRIPIIPNLIKFIFGHRGITHSLLIVASAFLLDLITKSRFLFSFTLGYFFHLLGDSFSVNGIKWLQPFSQKSFKVPISFIKYKTGSTKETLIVILSIIILFLEFKYIKF